MASVEEQLLNSLRDLDKDDLKRFQWHLQNHEHISTSEMQNADVLDTVDKMVARLGPEEAVKITVNILKNMNQNNLAAQLESKHKEVSGFGVDDKSSVSLCDIKQRPERNNSDTHTTGFSQPKPSGLGIRTLLNWIMRVDEHCDLLLYMRSKDPLILHVYLFPVDDRVKEQVEKNEKSSYPILLPRPGRPFQMNTPHILDVPGASTIHPKEGITLTRETPPNYFKVKTRVENDLQMTLIREEDQKTVWTATIKKNELDLIRPKRDEPRLNSEEVQWSEPEDRRNASVSVENQPIQSDWKRPHRITESSQEFKSRILKNTDEVYIPKDKSQRKRSALLITNIRFKHSEDNRAGAERDEENMEWLLKALDYSVEKYRDLTGQQISARVKNFAARPEHKDSDSTFVVLMSHGKRIQNKDAILGVNYDEKENPKDVFFVDDIFSSLNYDNCPALNDKPKVILIQACRGGHPGAVDIQSDSIVHREKDFVCFKSCLPDNSAWRNMSNGSYFICYIMEVFCKQAHVDDIMELFRKVTSNMEKDTILSAYGKLMPCIDRTSLPKKLYLFPGL